MTSGSGTSPHEPPARRWPRIVAHLALSSAACLTIAACARAASADPTPSPTPPNKTTGLPRPTRTPLPPTRTAIPEHRMGLGVPDYEDNFQIDSGWETGPSARGAVSRLDDKLVVSVRGPASILSSLSPAGPLADFFVEIEVRSEICEAGDEYGLMVRAGGRGSPWQDSHYRFLITCGGAVRASRFLSGVEGAVQPITPSADVIPGAPAVNRIGVSAIGDQFRFFVNDIQVFQFEDGEIPGGRIGVIVRSRRGAQTTVSFDDFRLWDLAEG